MDATSTSTPPAPDGGQPPAPPGPAPIYGYGAIPQIAIPAVIVYPTKALREPCAPVTEFDDKLREGLKFMAASMDARDGLAIAAPQVGIGLRVIVVSGAARGAARADDVPLAFINPEVVFASEETETDAEGCLSFPKITVPIARPVACTIKAQNASGEWFTVDAKGLYARALLHEIEHLDGKLIVDYASPMKKRMIDAKMAKFIRGLARRAKAKGNGVPTGTKRRELRAKRRK